MGIITKEDLLTSENDSSRSIEMKSIRERIRFHVFIMINIIFNIISTKNQIIHNYIFTYG